tara:strand:- start:1571 stop:2074 length:504 start_codon:yes stop_codon:yes gene_type:complete
MNNSNLEKQVQIISNIIYRKTIELGIIAGCIPISILTSNILSHRNIKNSFNVGYLNINKQFSLWHCWVSIDNIPIDIQFNAYEVLMPQTYSEDIEYSSYPLYEIIDEDTEEEKEIKRENIKVVVEYRKSPNKIFEFIEKTFGIMPNTKELINELNLLFMDKISINLQ